MKIMTMIVSVFGALIGILILLAFTAEATPEIQSYGNDVNDTGAPLSGLFASDSILPLVWMGGILLAIVGAIFAAVWVKKSY